ncbi:hypothetical protein C8029_04070 [Roseobacter sp. TSBP12]|nr:hypothetical protein C8029_04070 [Roseobacter sp. TSBP12]
MVLGRILPRIDLNILWVLGPLFGLVLCCFCRINSTRYVPKLRSNVSYFCGVCLSVFNIGAGRTCLRISILITNNNAASSLSSIVNEKVNGREVEWHAKSACHLVLDLLYCPRKSIHLLFK